MIEYLNELLVLIINIAIVIGISFLIYFYVRLKRIDSKIEKLHRKFEGERSTRRGQGRGIPVEIIDRQIAKLQKEKDEEVAPLERERQVIISKIPFIK